jgi:polyhydroxyalkanoate synthase
VPGETFRQFVKDCYHKNLLIQSKLELGGKCVDLKNITMPLLNYYGQYDHLVPPAACELLTSKVGSKDTEDMCLKTGHIGIYVSSKVQEEFVPKIAVWLKERDGVTKERKTKKSPAKKATIKKIGTKASSARKKAKKQR